jgi:hypothetical protein
MCSKQGLTCLENHLIVYFKKFVNKQPSSISTQFSSVSVPQDPISLFELNAALLSGERIVIKFDITICHSSNSDEARGLRKSEDLVSLWSIQELQLYFRPWLFS